MVGTTWKLKTIKEVDLIVTVLRLTEQRDAWVCVVIYDSDGLYQPGQLREYEEPTLHSTFRRIG